MVSSVVLLGARSSVAAAAAPNAVIRPTQSSVCSQFGAGLLPVLPGATAAAAAAAVSRSYALIVLKRMSALCSFICFIT
jgi:hypothetical protein